jgi:hypothetical protein
MRNAVGSASSSFTPGGTGLGVIAGMYCRRALCSNVFQAGSSGVAPKAPPGPEAPPGVAGAPTEPGSAPVAPNGLEGLLHATNGPPEELPGVAMGAQGR